MITLDIEQGTPEWIKARLGIPTASNFDKIVTTKGEPSKQAEKYMYQLAGEKVSGIKEESYQNSAMEKGIITEQEASDYYELLTDEPVKKVGFCYLNDEKRVGASPDRLVGIDGLLEIKCPLVSTHVGYLLAGTVPTTYFQQIQGQMYVTGLKWCDFMSYSVGIKPLIVRVERDEVFIKKFAVELEIFCQTLDEIVERIK